MKDGASSPRIEGAIRKAAARVDTHRLKAMMTELRKFFLSTGMIYFQ
jgi:hypothetical protein